MKGDLDVTVTRILMNYFGFDSNVTSRLTQQEINNLVYSLIGPELKILWLLTDERVIS
jgi:hypothetical protein